MTWFYVAAAVVAVVGGVVSADQSRKAAHAEEDAERFNAEAARERAKVETKNAGLQEEEQRRRARIQIGKQVAASSQAGAGLNEGLLRQSVFDAEEDALAIRYEGSLKAAGLQDQASLSDMAGSRARQKGKDGQTNAYLNAASSLVDIGSSYSKSTKKT